MKTRPGRAHNAVGEKHKAADFPRDDEKKELMEGDAYDVQGKLNLPSNMNGTGQSSPKSVRHTVVELTCAPVTLHKSLHLSLFSQVSKNAHPFRLS